MNTTNTSIRFYSVARDAFEAGDCPTCARCGCTMRHVTEINGALYGSGCGKIVIASMENTQREIDKLVAEAAAVLPGAANRFRRGDLTATECTERAYRCNDAGKFDWAMAWQALHAAVCKQKITPAFKIAR